MKNRKKLFILISIILLGGIILYLINIRIPVNYIKIDILPQESRGTWKIFYDMGQGFDDKSFRKPKLLNNDNITEAWFRFPLQKVKNLRVTVDGLKGNVKISSISLHLNIFLFGISFKLHEWNASAILNDFYPGSNLDSMKRNNDYVHMQFLTGTSSFISRVNWDIISDKINVSGISKKLIAFVKVVLGILNAFFWYLVLYMKSILNFFRKAGEKALSKLSNNSLIRLLIQKIDWFNETTGEDHLIKLDRRGFLFVVFGIVIFFILIFFKFHYSSIGMWDVFIPEYEKGHKATKSVLDFPKAIRSDEWLVNTPNILSQIKKNYPIENPSIGSGKAPLLLSMPVKHFSAVARPQNWGFYLLDTDRGFSFFWNYKVFGLFVSSFFLFMLITRNRFWLSIFGSIMIFFSNFNQWWFSTTAPEMIISANIIFISSVSLLMSRKRMMLVIHALFLMMFLINFLLAFYPPFQVPLVILVIALFTGFLAQNACLDDIKKYFIFRAALIIITIASLALFMGLYWIDCKETIQLVMNTVYPGMRISTGGEFGVPRLFSGFFSLYFREDRFLYGNVCENSSFIMFYPLIIGMVIVQGIKIRFKPLMTALSILLIIMSIYIIWGFPVTLSKLTLFSFVPSTRMIIGLGMGNIILMVLFMQGGADSIFKSSKIDIIISLAVLSAFIIFGYHLNSTNSGFFKHWQILLTAVILSAAVEAYITGKYRRFSIIMSLYVIASSLLVFPITYSLDYFYKKKLYRVIENIAQKDPDSLWITYKSVYTPNFIKSAGINTLNGTKYTPDIKSMKQLSSKLEDSHVYNRYAHIIIENNKNINTVDFTLPQEDLFIIYISPFSHKLKNLNVRYILMPDDPEYYNINEGKKYGIIPVVDQPVDGYWILMRKYENQ